MLKYYFMFLLFAMPKLTFSQLEQHQWKDRVLLIFAKNENQQDFITQSDFFKQQAVELKDRDLLTYTLFQNNTGLNPKNSPLKNTRVAAFQNRFNPKNQDFLLMLFGKDGGVKLRSNEPVKPSYLFNLVDGMPMRRAEIKRKKSG